MGNEFPLSRILRYIMGSLREVNIKYDMPTADQAVKRTTYEIENARRTGISCVKIVHGYGSHGKGGKIRVEVRAYLERMKRQKRISDYIPGERFSIFDEATRAAFAKCGELRQDSDLERANNGMTIIII